MRQQNLKRHTAQAHGFTIPISKGQITLAAFGFKRKREDNDDEVERTIKKKFSQEEVRSDVFEDDVDVEGNRKDDEQVDTDKFDGIDASGQGDELDYNLNKEAPHADRKTETENKDKSGQGELLQNWPLGWKIM